MEGMMNTSKLQDKLLRCLECGADFTFTVGEQRYFLSKGLESAKALPPMPAEAESYPGVGGGAA